MIRLKQPVVSTRTGLVFPTGQNFVAERDAISIIVHHHEQPEVTIRVAYRNVFDWGSVTEQEPTKPNNSPLPKATDVQMSLF